MELSLQGKVWARHFGFGHARPLDDHRTPLCHMTGTLLAAIAKFLSGASVRWIDCQPDTSGSACAGLLTITARRFAT